MARKPQPQPPKVSPLQMADALTAINGAASMFAATVETAAHLLQQPDINLTQAKALGQKLAEELEKFRKVVWPET